MSWERGIVNSFYFIQSLVFFFFWERAIKGFKMFPYIKISREENTTVVDLLSKPLLKCLLLCLIHIVFLLEKAFNHTHTHTHTKIALLIPNTHYCNHLNTANVLWLSVFNPKINITKIRCLLNYILSTMELSLCPH